MDLPVFDDFNFLILKFLRKKDQLTNRVVDWKKGVMLHTDIANVSVLIQSHVVVIVEPDGT